MLNGLMAKLAKPHVAAAALGSPPNRSDIHGHPVSHSQLETSGGRNGVAEG